MTQYHHPEYLCIIFCQISLHVSLVAPGVSICAGAEPGFKHWGQIEKKKFGGPKLRK
jgi:hypothetical protein